MAPQRQDEPFSELRFHREEYEPLFKTLPGRPSLSRLLSDTLRVPGDGLLAAFRVVRCTVFLDEVGDGVCTRFRTTFRDAFSRHKIHLAKAPKCYEIGGGCKEGAHNEVYLVLRALFGVFSVARNSKPI